ncbi:hypothetical protein HID58_094261 [Brassica napus]|uniref:Uncharacterized protein n=1 Tax=Brassica napus TaxID=3708 RepID=A0ABQ7XAB8_BRANA|nr:hypothetical protein HID58_094261 [Brassica napus]
MHGRGLSEDRKKGHRRLMFRPPSRLISSLEASGGSSSLSLSSPSSFSKDGRRISVGDCALFKPPQDCPPFIGLIRLLVPEREGGGSFKVRVNWLYRPGELKLGKGVLLEAQPNEIFYSFHEDEIPAASLLHPCKVTFLPKGVELASGISSFVCWRVYDVMNESIWWLTDQDYIDERQQEVDNLLRKTRSKMTLQQGGRSPKSTNSPTTSQAKTGTEGMQNSSSSSSQGKGRKRERGDQGSESVKRERPSRIDDGGSGFVRTESSLKSEIAKITERGRLVDSEGVEKLVQLMLPEKNEKKTDLIGRSILASVVAATDKFDCLSRFVQLRGLPVFDEWLQEVHKGKIGDGSSPKDNGRSVDDFLLILLRALDKLPVNLNALQTCNIGKSVNHLRSHKNSEIGKKARSLVDTWKKRVEAEMDAKSGSNQGASWPGRYRQSEVSHGGRHSGVSADAARASASHQHPSKAPSPVPSENNDTNRPNFSLDGSSKIEDIIKPTSPTLGDVVKTGKGDSGSHSSMNALIESCVRDSEANACEAGVDDVGMNLLASAAADEISKSPVASPAVSLVSDSLMNDISENHTTGLPNEQAEALAKDPTIVEHVGSSGEQLASVVNVNDSKPSDSEMEDRVVADVKTEEISETDGVADTVMRTGNSALHSHLEAAGGAQVEDKPKVILSSELVNKMGEVVSVLSEFAKDRSTENVDRSMPEKLSDDNDCGGTANDRKAACTSEEHKPPVVLSSELDKETAEDVTVSSELPKGIAAEKMDVGINHVNQTDKQSKPVTAHLYSSLTNGEVEHVEASLKSAEVGKRCATTTCDDGDEAEECTSVAKDVPSVSASASASAGSELEARVEFDLNEGHRRLLMLRPPSRLISTASSSSSLSLSSPSSFSKDGRRISVGDCALFKPPQDCPPFIGLIRLLVPEREGGGSFKVRVNWLYRPGELKLGKGVLLEAQPNEIFYSFHEDEIPAASLLHPCKVTFLPRGVELPSGISSFVCWRVYDVMNESIWWLTDQDYIDERQQEVDKLLCKSLQQCGCSPMLTTSQVKTGTEGMQNSSSSSSQGKGRKRERGDQGSESVKRERPSRGDDSGSGFVRKESSLKSEIAKITERGRLVDSEGVEKLVQLMLPEKNEKKTDLIGRSILASAVAATDKFDCLSRFVQLRGLSVFDEWLQEVHRRKIGDGSSPKENDRSVDEFLLILLRALDKLPVNLNALQTCNIGKSVNRLRSHKNSEIGKKARSLVDTWKKRVEAEMDAKPGRPRQSEVSHGSRHSVVSFDATKTSVSHLHPFKSVSGISDNSVKSATTSPSSTRSAPSPGTGVAVANVGQQKNTVAVHAEGGLSRSISSQRTVTFEKAEGCSNKLLVKLPKCGERGGEHEKAVNESSKIEDIVKPTSPTSGDDVKTEKGHGESHSLMNALIESCVRDSEANACVAGADDVGMNLLATVAADEMSKSPVASPSCLESNENSDDIAPTAGHTSGIGGNISDDGDSGVVSDLKTDEISETDRVADTVMRTGNSALPECKAIVLCPKVDSLAVANSHSDVVDDNKKEQKPPVVLSSELVKETGEDVKVSSGFSKGVAAEKIDIGINHVNQTDKKNKPVTAHLDSSVTKIEVEHVEASLKSAEVGKQCATTTCADGHETEECTSVAKDVPSVSALAGSELEAGVKFDLNEAFNGDDTRKENSSNFSGSLSLTSTPLQTSRPPASITVAAAAKGAFVPRDDLLRNKPAVGWRGSAATSAFRPAEPRKVQEVASCDASTTAGKQTKTLLDFDLNVPDERVLEELPSQRFANPTNPSGVLDLDLNRLDDPADMNNHTVSSGHRVNSTFQQTNLSSGGSRDFDLNDGPAVDDVNVVESSLGFSQNSRSAQPVISGIRPGFSSWFPAVNNYSAMSIPQVLPERGSGPQRMVGPTSEVSSYTPDMCRGPVLLSSPAVSFPPSAFQYPGFPFGSSFPLSSANFSGASTPYMDSSSSGRLCFPPVNSQILGPGVAIPSNYPRPYVVNLPNGSSNGGVSDSSNNAKWFRSGLDLNSGPGGHETDEAALVQRQLSSSGSLPLRDEARMYQMSGGTLKRKEPDGGWDGGGYK